MVAFRPGSEALSHQIQPSKRPLTFVGHLMGGSGTTSLEMADNMLNAEINALSISRLIQPSTLLARRTCTLDAGSLVRQPLPIALLLLPQT